MEEFVVGGCGGHDRLRLFLRDHLFLRDRGRRGVVTSGY